MEKIPNLTTDKNRPFYINKEKLKEMKDELEYFLKDENNMNNIKFSEKVMRSQEIMTNNNIEGYKDDVSVIEKVIKNKKAGVEKDKLSRIINLHKGYKYILERHTIDKNNLKELYDTLSKNLLSDYDLNHMGDYDREDDVFIFYSDSLQIEPDKGVNSDLLDKKMDDLLNYLNTNNDLESMTDYYIKSQIAHFYFVYLHPYFDINGRTSRTTAMWYLLNNDAYPYIIFNRAIRNTKNTYYQEIRYGKESRDLTNFMSYLMLNTKMELEKEYVVDLIKQQISQKLDTIEISSIINILSMKGLKTLKDFAFIYNSKNEKKKVKEIYTEMLEPLLDKEIIVINNYTSSYYDNDKKNFVFNLNPKLLDIDKQKVRKIEL